MKSKKINYNDFKNHKIIFIFGNDNSINDIDFDLIKKKSVTTAGVNRIFLATEVDYLLFLDNIVLTEIGEQNISLKKTTLLTCNYNLRSVQEEFFNKTLIDKKFKNHIHIDKYIINNNIYGSVSALMYILKNCIFPKEKIMFVLVGVSLKYTDVHSHFWKNDKYKNIKTYNKKNKGWYNHRFALMRQSIVSLAKYQRFNIISCSTDGPLKYYIPTMKLSDLMQLIP